MSDCTIPQKRCTKCNQEFPSTTEFFHKSRASLSARCKQCVRAEYQENREEKIEYRRKRYRENPEAERMASKKYRERHPDRVKTAAQKKYQENRDNVLEQRRAYYLSNTNKIRTRKAIYQKNLSPEALERRHAKQRIYYQHNINDIRHKKRIATRNYRINNRAKYRMQHRVTQANHRARSHGVNERITVSDIEAQYAIQDGCCWHCSNHVYDSYHMDHLIPLSRGGSNTPDNIVISCPSCNARKWNKMPDEWEKTLR